MSEHRPTWPPPGYSMRPNGVRLACCDRCGALIGDTDLHDQSHTATPPKEIR